MNIKYLTIVLTFLLSMISLPSHAGKIYRFLDKNGVSTLSKVLPPSIAQKGYDILDDKSFRLIERIPKAEDLAKINEEEARIAQVKEDEDKARNLRLIEDRSLLDRYPDDRVLIRARDADLAFINKQIVDVKEHRELNQEKLFHLQQGAAEAELSGRAVSAGLEENLKSARNKIANDQLHLKRLHIEYAQTEKQYDVDLARLRKLLNIPAPVVENIVPTKDVATDSIIEEK